ncbi:MAG: Spore coat protein CotJA [Firmicutes bacterium]|nr:Spore coat protein CotJA [Bacillota bacterium]
MYKKSAPHIDTIEPETQKMLTDEASADSVWKEETRPSKQVHSNMVLGHSYVPWQVYTKAFSPKEALMRGTLFPELYGVYPIPE